MVDCRSSLADRTTRSCLVWWLSVSVVQNNTGNLTTCPIFNPYWGWYTNPAICSGAGTCSNETYYKCNCTAGYKGRRHRAVSWRRPGLWLDAAESVHQVSR